MIKVYSALITEFTQADYTRQYSLLDRAIRDKIDAKKSDKDKMRSLAGYILFYRGALELYQKAQVEIRFNQHGKPLCDFCFFSISHSGDYVFCVISNEIVGIDVQEIKNIPSRKKYKFFNAKENDYVNSNSNLLSVRYTEIFTKKEAAVKMLGESLSYCRFIDTFSDEFLFETDINDFVLTICRQNK